MKGTTLRGRIVAVAGLLALASGGCRDVEVLPLPDAAPPPPRRHVDKQGSVRSLPPHAVSEGAVGPYRIGEPMAAILADMPGGPRLNVLKLPRVVDTRVARIEENNLLVGGQEHSEFIGIVGRDIARTEAGLGVATTVAKIMAAAEGHHDASVVRDRRMFVLPALPSLRFIAGGTQPTDVVTAMLLHPPAAAPSPARPAHAPGCQAATLPLAAIEPLPGPRSGVVAACFGDVGDALLIGDDAVARYVVDNGKWRRDASLMIKGVVVAGPLRTAARHDDLIVVVRERDAYAVKYVASLWRLDGNRFTRVAGDIIYRIEAINAEAVGASLDELELVIDATFAGGQLEFGGVLLMRGARGLRDVVPLLPAVMPLRRRPPIDAKPPEVAPAGVPADAAAGDPAPSSLSEASP
ncbi:MAG: hypothetical protein IPL79_02245 [Myxococcales bacterium]|nr:hypothetical protein [Myxococcales bacterium]